MFIQPKLVSFVGVLVLIGSLLACQDKKDPVLATPVETVRTFNAQQGQHPENIAFASDGSLYVTLHAAAMIWKQDALGQEWFIQLPLSNPDSSQTRANGIVIDRNQHALVLVRSDLAEFAGIWRFTPDRTLTKWVNLPAKAGLNGLAQDEAGNLYATDDTNGIIFQIKVGESKAQVWTDNSLLKPLSDATSGFSVYGVNGIKVYQNTVFVSNPSRSALYKIPIGNDGAAGALTEAFAGRSFVSVDDMAFDETGNLYITSVAENSVSRINPSGESQVILTRADGLDQPTAVAFGNRPGNRTYLYVTNGSFYTPPGSVSNASVLRKEVGISGVIK